MKIAKVCARNTCDDNSQKTFASVVKMIMLTIYKWITQCDLVVN